jgi:hypothetical protein
MNKNVDYEPEAMLHRKIIANATFGGIACDVSTLTKVLECANPVYNASSCAASACAFVQTVAGIDPNRPLSANWTAVRVAHIVH